MSRASLYRKMHSLKHEDISQFIREVRLIRAMEMLQNNEGTAAEIAFRVGFSSPNYFNKCFHEYFGYAPGELKNHESGNEPEELTVESTPKKPKRTILLLGLVIGLIIIVTASFFLIWKVSNSKEKSIAVIPFINDSRDSTNVYFING